MESPLLALPPGGIIPRLGMPMLLGIGELGIICGLLGIEELGIMLALGIILLLIPCPGIIELPIPCPGIIELPIMGPCSYGGMF